MKQCKMNTTQSALLILSSSPSSHQNSISLFKKCKRLLNNANNSLNILSLFVFYLLFYVNFSFIAQTSAQSNQRDVKTDDLAFPYREKSNQDGSVPKQTRRPASRPSRIQTSKTQLKSQASTKNTQPQVVTTTPHIHTTFPINSNIQPFIYSSETLNKTHSNQFKKWINIKSSELFELTKNYSGFKLLNETYNVHLRKHASFAWINFTEMIINISSTISDVLYKKTLLVKNLTDFVEKSFDVYRNDIQKVKESAKYLYYDAKSPKTFCDIHEASIAFRAKYYTDAPTTTVMPVSTESPAKTTTIPTFLPPNAIAANSVTESELAGSLFDNQTLAAQDDMVSMSKRHQKRMSFNDFDYDDVYWNDLVFETKESGEERKEVEQIEVDKEEEDNDDDEIDDKCHYLDIFPHLKQRVKRNNLANSDKTVTRTNTRMQRPGSSITRKPGGRTRTTAGPGVPGMSSSSRKFSRTSTQSTPTLTSTVIYDSADERTDLESIYDYTTEFDLTEQTLYWNMTCINRTFDENYKNFKKGVNRNQSTIHVPTNVYKQDLIINMTAYWTRTLNEEFKKNYDNDNEMFWQYFCSSTGLYRLYPGIYWSYPKNEDLFDCRLQSWYIMAAASPKDVIILLDRSGSMTGLRLGIAKKLIEAIMDTLSDNDFFNVLTFSNTVDYLMNMDNETEYRERFVQAGRTNKKIFLDKLAWFKNTSDIADFNKALIKSFELLFKPLDKDSCGCNKAIMIITDGSSENAEEVFKKYNWDTGKKVRVFTFLIGRDVTDTRQVEWMACANNGKFFHVATLADIDRHVHGYIPVLSRPMALLGTHDTTWSNVFIGHLDKELKIAVARPAFKTKSSLLSKTDLQEKTDEYFKQAQEDIKNKNVAPTEPQDEENDDYDNQYQDSYYYQDAEAEQQDIDPSDQYAVEEKVQTSENTTSDVDKKSVPNEVNLEEEENILRKTDLALRKQSVLLGVVGIDVPVLRLISKVSPKYQMGVGIYIIMLDNNGFIVYHPSIRKEITQGGNSVKASSQSIDLERFEIPIGNEEDFDELEHEMIDQITSNKTLENWKREGLRVIRRKTEYVYTTVSRTPFSVAIASPSSFGRYYIDLPAEKEVYYEDLMKVLMKNKYETMIQVYNCTYTYTKLAEKLLNSSLYSDYCIKYLFQDPDQILAIKSDLVFHDIYYDKYNFSIFAKHPNLVRSSFYGTYSGMTFYLPVTFYRIKPLTTTSPTMTKKGQTQLDNVTTQSQSSATMTSTPVQQKITNRVDMTEAPSEMTVNVELGSIFEPFTTTTTEPNIPNFTERRPLNGPRIDNTNESYFMSLNLFSTENSKHTYSFEKQYYTRSIEFSDFLRTNFNMTSPVANYFLNESSSKEARKDTISATIPIWLDKVPTAVTGVVYDAQKLQEILFNENIHPGCNDVSCKNLCSPGRGMNLTCYLVDEHGIVVLATERQSESKVNRLFKEPTMGQPLYKVNPWLMKNLEYEGIYDIVLPGKKLPECMQLPKTFSSSSTLFSVVKYTFKLIMFLLGELKDVLFKYVSMIFIGSLTVPVTNAQLGRNPTLAERIEAFNIEWRMKNSHCYHFGIYSFNFTKWQLLDSSHLRVWCNSSNKVQRHYLAGYLQYTNLIMLVVEDEYELIHCGNITTLIETLYGKKPNVKLNRTANGTNETNMTWYEIESTTTPVSILNEESFLFNSDSSKTNYTNETELYSSSLFNTTEKKFKVNRYRKKPDQCFNYFENEKEYLPCVSLAPLSHSSPSTCLIACTLFALGLLKFILI